MVAGPRGSAGVGGVPFLIPCYIIVRLGDIPIDEHGNLIFLPLKKTRGDSFHRRHK